MEWLNYHHLLYFWVIAKEGSIARACEQLHLAQPTISSQLRKLEQSVGEKLFERSGRKLILTHTGQMVYEYAEEIFGLGRELQDALQGRSSGRARRLAVGVPDALPKLIVYRLLKPALALEEPVRLVCYEGKLDQLVGELALHHFDIVLSDSPISPSVHVRAFHHLLGECGVSIFGTAEFAARYQDRFPQSLEGAPLLLPTPNTSVRRALDQWFDSQDLRPQVAGEFEDSALLKVFGQAGEGLFPAPTVLEQEIRQQYGVQVVGRIEVIRERFYALSVERKLKHPAVLAICTAAREELFRQSSI